MNDASHFHRDGDDLVIRLRLTPKSSSDKVLGVMADRLKIAITAPPVDGKANAHLIKFLAKQFGVAKSNVQIVNGETARDKTICISSPQVLSPQFLIEWL